MANLSNINNKFIVTDGGNVLIGQTNNSSGILQIKDTQTSSFNDGLAITRNNAAQTGYINMVGGAFNFNSPGLSYKFRNNGTQTLELDSSGNVGIGITPNVNSNVVNVIQLGKGMTLLGNVNDDRATMAANLYLDTGTAFRYVMDGLAGRFSIEDGNMVWGTASSGTAGTVATVDTKMTLLNNGNLGIGCSPDYKLQVESTSDADLFSIKSTAIANNTQMRLGISGNDSVISGTGGSTGSLVFKTYGSEKMRIDSSGNVGVGSGTPLYLLGDQDIGQIAVNRVPSTGVITDTSRSAAYINLNASNGGSSLTFHTANANNLAPTERMRITSAGQVQVGYYNTARGGSNTTFMTGKSGTTYLELNGGDVNGEGGILFADGSGGNYGLINYSHVSDIMQFYTASGEKMRITNAGQVNIYPVNDTSEAFRVFRGTGAYASQSISIDAKGGDANIRLLATDTARSTVFYRSSDGGGNFAESMRIDNNGSIGMGANSAPYRLRVKSDATVDNGIYLSAGTGSGNHALYVENKDGTAEFFAVRGDGEIRLNATSGHTYAAQGIRLGANASANELDDYEEGTFTATTNNDGVGLPVTANYRKIGQLVTYTVYIPNWSPTSAGTAVIAGFPFTAITSNGYGVGNVTHSTGVLNCSGGYHDGTNWNGTQNNSTGRSSWVVASARSIMVSGFYYTTS
jgi:hypothetical protein